MDKFQNSSIYKICCKNTEINKIYIGSTADFNTRKINHKAKCKNTKNNYYVYQYIRENGGWNNFEMVEIKKVKCDTKKELRTIERQVEETFDNTLNKNKAILTPEERYIYKKEYREKHRDKQKLYYIKYNTEERKKLRNQKYQLTKHKLICACGSIVRDTISHALSKNHRAYLQQINSN